MTKTTAFAVNKDLHALLQDTPDANDDDDTDGNERVNQSKIACIHGSHMRYYCRVHQMEACEKGSLYHKDCDLLDLLEFQKIVKANAIQLKTQKKSSCRQYQRMQSRLKADKENLQRRMRKRFDELHKKLRQEEVQAQRDIDRITDARNNELEDEMHSNHALLDEHTTELLGYLHSREVSSKFITAVEEPVESVDWADEYQTAHRDTEGLEDRLDKNFDQIKAAVFNPMMRYPPIVVTRPMQGMFGLFRDRLIDYREQEESREVREHQEETYDGMSTESVDASYDGSEDNSVDSDNVSAVIKLEEDNDQDF